MRHARNGKKLGRDSAHRKALYANLACSVIEHGRIKTTVAKAKAVKPFVEQMITLGKRGDLHARRLAVSELRSQDATKLLFDEVAPRFADRPGGYTRILKLGARFGDAAEMCYLELVDYEPESAAPPMLLRVTLVVAIVVAVIWLDSPWSWILVACAAIVEIGETGLLYRWSRRRRSHVGAEALVGATAIVETPTQVRVQGELWRARGELHVGEQVRVTAVDGLTLEVEPL